MSTQHYIRRYYPGTFVSDLVDEETDHRDPGSVDTKESRMYAFQFFDRTKVETLDSETLLGDPKNFSPIYYLGGEALSKDDVQEGSILWRNMESNQWDCVVRSRFGQVFPVPKEGFVILDVQ